MNLPVPFAGRVVAWSFDAIMRSGGAGLAERLRARARPDATAPAAAD